MLEIDIMDIKKMCKASKHRVDVLVSGHLLQKLRYFQDFTSNSIAIMTQHSGVLKVKRNITYMFSAIEINEKLNILFQTNNINTRTLFT